jgi:hypothetical protein
VELENYNGAAGPTARFDDAPTEALDGAAGDTIAVRVSVPAVAAQAGRSPARDDADGRSSHAHGGWSLSLLP